MLRRARLRTVPGESRNSAAVSANADADIRPSPLRQTIRMPNLSVCSTSEERRRRSPDPIKPTCSPQDSTSISSSSGETCLRSCCSGNLSVGTVRRSAHDGCSAPLPERERIARSPARCPQPFGAATKGTAGSPATAGSRPAHPSPEPPAPVGPRRSRRAARPKPRPTPLAAISSVGYTVDDATLSPTANRFTNGGAKFAAMTTSNPEVHYGSGVASNDADCIGYQVGVSAATPAGTYSTTVTYTAVPVF